MSDMQVQAELKLKDNLSRAAGTALESLGKAAAKTGAAVDSVGRGQGSKLTAKSAADAAKRLREAANGAQELGRAVSVASNSVQRFKNGVQDSGNIVAAMCKNMKGTQWTALDAAAISAKRFKDGAQDAARLTAQWRNNLQGVSRSARDALGQMRVVGRGFAATVRGAGALGAAGYVAKAAMDKPVDYEKQLASMANVAYADRDAAGRIAGKADLDTAIVSAIRQGGGKREDAAATLNAMLASGAVDEATAKDKLLPIIMKGSTASGASGEELANILVKGISQGQFTADEAGLALDKAIKAGEAGQFELKDMARWLPQIISAGKGMKGMAGFDAHLANLQGIAQVTGSNDQAGNAYFNLLGKLTSTDATSNFKKLKIDLPAELAKGRMQGKDTVTSFVDLVQNRVVAKDKRFRGLQKKIAATSDQSERRALMEQAAEILQGTAVGKVIQDREALLGLVGIMNQRSTINDVLADLQHAQGSTQTSFDVMASTGAYAQEQLANEKDIASTGVYDRVKGPVASALRGTAQAAQQNPVAAQVVVGGATAATSAAAGGAAVSVLGGGSALSGAGVGLAKGATMAAKNAPVLMLGTSALKVYNTATDTGLTSAEKKMNNMETYGEFGGALAGAAMGAAAGSFVPVLGNIAGGVLGGLAGWWSGGKAGKATGEIVWGDDVAAQKGQSGTQDAVVQAAQLLQQQPIQATIQLNVELDGDKVAEAVEQRQLRESTRR